MTLDDAPAREHERLRIELQAAQCERRLADENRRPCSVGACHVPQPLDRVHGKRQ
jgi:hypothetical protein